MCVARKFHEQWEIDINELFSVPKGCEYLRCIKFTLNINLIFGGCWTKSNELNCIVKRAKAMKTAKFQEELNRWFDYFCYLNCGGK